MVSPESGICPRNPWCPRNPASPTPGGIRSGFRGTHTQLKGRHYAWCPRNPVPGLPALRMMSPDSCPRTPVAWIVFGVVGLGGVCANERTNIGVRALFVRSHRSQGMGRGFVDPFVRSLGQWRRDGSNVTGVRGDQIVGRSCPGWNCPQESIVNHPSRAAPF
jgi:hypothetical protein